MSNIRIGTCSWKYDSWKGILYPDKERFDYLAEYSKHFNTVEIDQWFWSLFEPTKIVLPNESDVKSYAQSVSDDFRFTIKVPNSLTLTHFYNKNKTEALEVNPFFLKTDLFNKFLDSLVPMQKNIGALMFQFEYLNKQKINGLNEFMDRFESFVESIDKRYTYGVEIRNPNFLRKPFFDLLERNKIAMVFLQGYYMPPIWEVFDEYKEQIKSTAILRLHGPDRSGIEKKTGSIWNKIVEPKDEELDNVAGIISYLRNKNVDTYVNVNNHYEGSAPLTINRINKLLT